MRETLTSTGNGYFCLRGASEWEDSGDVHYAGSYAHGTYNRETTIMGGRPVPQGGERHPGEPRRRAGRFRPEGAGDVDRGHVRLR